MEAIVRLYSSERDEIHISKYYNDKNISINLLEWEKKYQNPVEMTEIIGTFIDNNDKYKINMWISLDEGIFININDNNADKVIRYIYERYPY